MNTVEFLDAVKKRHALPSDYALAKLLGWRTQRISEYRTTPRELDDEGCVQIAAALDLPAPYVMACIAAARAKRADIKKHWLAAAKLLKTGTAAAILVTTLALSQNAPARASESVTRLTGQAIHYAPFGPDPRMRRRRPLEERTLRRRRRKKRSVIVATDTIPADGKIAV